MFKPVKVIDVELSRQIADIAELERYGALKALVRLHGVPIGNVTLATSDSRCTTTALLKAIFDQPHGYIIEPLLRRGLANALQSGELRFADLIPRQPQTPANNLPLATVAVCTRDRVADLALCLDALNAVDYPKLDLIVVDNAPSDDATERLIKDDYPTVRYVREPRPGLDWARNRAIAEARGEIIAFTDDDVVVDAGWVSALAQVFSESPEVMAVTGLVVPYELETEAQVLFERYYGFGKGFERKRYHIDRGRGRKEKFHIRAGRFGTGANMAFRRSLFEKIGGFDPALDVGTVTNGGGDLEMFFRVIQEGYTLVYEPRAIVRHRHRRDYAGLRKQMTDWGIGCYSYLVRSFLAYPRARFDIFRFGLKWLWKGNLRRLLVNQFRPSGIPKDLVRAQLRGSFIGLFRYQKARRIAAEIADSFAPIQTTTVVQERATHRTLATVGSSPSNVEQVVPI
jgi:GT2 family glycosyltransferase